MRGEGRMGVEGRMGREDGRERKGGWEGGEEEGRR